MLLSDDMAWKKFPLLSFVILFLNTLPLLLNSGFCKNCAASYSIWLYKGGSRCSHRWTRKIYAKKDGQKGLGENISTTKAISEGFKPEKNAKKVGIAPRNMQYEGYTAAYWKKMGFTYGNLKR